MSKNGVPWKVIFAVGFLIGFVTVVAAVTFAPGDAGQVSDGVPFGAPDGMNATIEGDTNVIMETDVLFPSSNIVQFKTEAGNITFDSNGPAWATVATDNITGTYTNITEIDATSNDISINPEDKRKITVGDDIDRIEFRDGSIDDGGVDFVYAGSSGSSKIVLFGLPANTKIGAVDKQAGRILGVTTTDANGVATFSSLPNSEHTVQLVTSSGGPSLSNSDPNQETVRYENVSLSIDVSDPDYPTENVTLEWYVDGTLKETTYATSSGTHSATVTLSDGQYDWHVEATDSYGATDSSATNTFTINHYNPQVSNVQPDGNLNSNPSQISADVSDQDFGNDGDTLTVYFILDGSQIDSQTISTDQTVTTSMPSSGQTGGSHDVRVEVTDDYGQTTTGTSSYTVPNTFFVRNETRHSELVAADGEVRIYGTDQVFTRTAPNGKFNMTGLPVNQDFIVEIGPTDENYTTRTVYIQSIYEQKDGYVLNTTAFSTVQSRFTLDDPTAEYDSNDVLQIRRPINISGTTTFQSVVADEFGVEGLTTTLQNDTRYRLKIIGDDGSQKVGTYRAKVSETVAVSPGNPTIPLNDTEYGYAYGAVLDNRTLEYQWVDPQDETDQLTVWIHERGNPSNKLQPNETQFNLGNYSGIATLSENESKTEWVVEFVVQRDGESFTVSRIVSNRKDLSLPIDQGWQLVIGISLLILFAGAFSVLNAGIGAILVSLVGGTLWYLGLLGGAATGMTVATAIFIAVISYMYKGAY